MNTRLGVRIILAYSDGIKTEFVDRDSLPIERKDVGKFLKDLFPQDIMDDSRLSVFNRQKIAVPNIGETIDWYRVVDVWSSRQLERNVNYITWEDFCISTYNIYVASSDARCIELYQGLPIYTYSRELIFPPSPEHNFYLMN